MLLNARIEQPVKPKQAPALQIPAVAQEQDCLESMERTPDEVPTETPESECGQELRQADHTAEGLVSQVTRMLDSGFIVPGACNRS